MSYTIAIYASSSDGIDPIFYSNVQELGKLLAENKFNLIFGGSNVGLMRTIADTVKGKCKLTGVLPRFLQDRGLRYQDLDELILTNDLRDRKGIIENRADAFLALPGGLGTGDEILEVLTLKQLNRHTKPILFFNVKGCYDKLLEWFEYGIKENLIKPSTRSLYFSSSNPEEILHYIINYLTR